MGKTHTELDAWFGDDFPFDPDDDAEMKALHEVLPDGHWIAEDFSTDERCLCLLRLDD